MDLQQPPQADQPPMDAGDWRRHLQPDFRQKVVNKITSILRAYVSLLDDEGLQELQNIAAQFEFKTYNAASSMEDYMDQISSKMLEMKMRFNAGPSNSAASFDSTPQTGISGDWHEEFYHKVKSMSSKALDASVSDIHSVVNTFDQIAGSAPGSGSRAADTEDLATMVEFPLQGRGTITHDESRGLKRTSSTAFNVVSSVGSFFDSFMQLTESGTSSSDLTATPDAKRRKVEICPSLLKEINEINERLIETAVDISKEDVCPDLPASTFESGILVKCSYVPVALCPSLKRMYASGHMPPIQPLRLLVPADYPRCPPILLDKPSPMCSENDLSMKVRSGLGLFLRTSSQPSSLTEIARAWNDCVRSVITEYVQKLGGGTFTSKYGKWEPCSSFTRHR